MAIQSFGEIQQLQPTNWWTAGGMRRDVRFYNRRNYGYADIYREQPNVRTPVDFRARNIAQLGLHVFRRVSDTDRVRLTDHPLAVLLGRPLPVEMKMTRYRLIEFLFGDLGVYQNAYWLKIRVGGQGGVGGLLPVPPQYVKVEGGLVPQNYVLTVGGDRKEFAPNEVVHFRAYNPENPIYGLSQFETLRRVLAEEHEAGDYREHFWQNAARMQGFVERPASAPEWSPTARERFVAEFNQLYSGGPNSGNTAVLEEGMTWKEGSFNAQESQYMEGRKLAREESARSLHIPLPMVGILDHATFSNIREQHKHLYQDALGPDLVMIEEDIKLQLLTDFEDQEGVYVEFNIQEKLAGDFEQQTQAFQAAVGRPWMTANEARAKNNLPSMGGDADQLVTPLNVLVGGQASPRDSAPKGENDFDAKAQRRKDFKGIDSQMGEVRGRHVEKWVEVLGRHYRRQEAAVLSRVKALTSGPSPKGGEGGQKGDIGGIWFDEERWNGELAADLFKLNLLTAGVWGRSLVQAVAGSLDNFDEAAFDEGMLPYLQEHSRIQAEYINGYTRTQMETALNAADPKQALKDLFNLAITVWVWRQAQTGVTSAANFGAHEGARASGLKEKTWRVNSGNPRDAHAAMNGETVGIRERFSNGMRWPGDPVGGAENNANCECSVEFS